MERATLSEEGQAPNFIGSWRLNDAQICDSLVSYFDKNENKHKQGAVSGGMDLSAKNSIDINISPNEIKQPGNEIFEKYFLNLFACYKDYAEQWPFLKEFASELETGVCNLQRYSSGQHFNALHSERTSLDTLHRIFAFMTYLNDVQPDQGGSTSFEHYGLEVQPQKGLTLIWPAEWTHAHKGNKVLSGYKYIITGWLHFPPRRDTSKSAALQPLHEVA